MPLRKDLAYNIHTVGRLLRDMDACILKFDEEAQCYYSDCPAQLLHLDFGFSVRAFEKYQCSICGKPIMDCEHITDDYYDDVECREIEGICIICGRSECHEHIIGQHYHNVQAYKIPYDIKLVTFDIVKDPEMKYARVQKYYFPKEDILTSMPDDMKDTFEYGITDLNCDHCLICKGYNPKLFDSLFEKPKDGEEVRL